MLFLTHLLLGVLIGLVGKGVFSGGNVYVWFFLVLLGAILPDIDEERSRITSWSGVVGKVISFFSKHRGFFHSLFFVALVCLLVRFLWSGYYGLGLFLGMMGHLVLDGMTRKGVSFLYPFSSWGMRGWIKTGSLGETIVQVGLLGLVVWRVLG